jgi:hypothetical protein
MFFGLVMVWELLKKSIGSLWARKKDVFFLEKGIFPAFASHSGAGIISYSSPLSRRSKVAHNFPTK